MLGFGAISLRKKRAVRSRGHELRLLQYPVEDALELGELAWSNTTDPYGGGDRGRKLMMSLIVTWFRDGGMGHHLVIVANARTGRIETRSPGG